MMNDLQRFLLELTEAAKQAVLSSSVSELYDIVNESHVSDELKVMLNGYIASCNDVESFLKLYYILNFQTKIISFNLHLERFFHDFVNKLSVILMTESLDLQERQKHSEHILNFINHYPFKEDSNDFILVIRNIWLNVMQLPQEEQITHIWYLCNAIDLYGQLLFYSERNKFYAII